MLTLPVVLRSHPIDDVLSKLEAALRGEPAPREVLDAVAELRHLREHNPRCVDLATRERDRRVTAETERDMAVAELGLVRRAWVLMGLPGSPPEGTGAPERRIEWRTLAEATGIEGSAARLVVEATSARDAFDVVGLVVDFGMAGWEEDVGGWSATIAKPWCVVLDPPSVVDVAYARELFSAEETALRELLSGVLKYNRAGAAG